MTKHTTDVTVAALRQWVLANQDDTGCREAADQLGAMGAIAVLLEMLDGPLTARCALEVAAALGQHGDARDLPELYRLRAEHERVAAMLDVAIENIEEDAAECTCDECSAAIQGRPGPGDMERPDVSPSGLPPFSRN